VIAVPAAVFVAIVARFPASRARAEVFRFVPAFTVTVPETGCVAGKFEISKLPGKLETVTAPATSMVPARAVAIASILPPSSKARAEVFRLLPALAVIVPEMG
jgi:hypothetical protein